VVDLGLLAEEQVIQLFGVALGKWLLGFCHEASPKWTIVMRQSYQYAINLAKGVMMLALAFELSPNTIPPKDATGMSHLEVSPKEFTDERACAVRLVGSVAAIRDIDSEIQNNAALREELIQAKADLLEAAGYDRAAYLRWVSDGEISS